MHDDGARLTARRARRCALRLTAAIAASLVLVAAPPLHAHGTYSPTQNNRYLKVSLGDGGAVRIAYGLMYGETPATTVRGGADTDRSGSIDDAESTAFGERVQVSVAKGLSVTVDGRRAAPEWETPLVSLGDRRVGPIAFAVDLVGTVRVMGAGPHVVSIDDATPVDDPGETELRIEEGPGTRVLGAWRGREDGGRQLRFLWNGPKASALEDRSVAFRFVDDTSRPPPSRRRLPIAPIGALVGVVVAAWLVRSVRVGPSRRSHK